MQDSQKLFIASDENTKIRSMKFSSTDEVNNHISNIITYIHEAIKINAKNITANTTQKLIIIPNELKIALLKNKLLEKFETITYSMKKEYIQWIEEAKKEETKQKRIEKTIQQTSLGKGLYDKYK